MYLGSCSIKRQGVVLSSSFSSALVSGIKALEFYPGLISLRSMKLQAGSHCSNWNRSMEFAIGGTSLQFSPHYSRADFITVSNWIINFPHHCEIDRDSRWGAYYYHLASNVTNGICVYIRHCTAQRTSKKRREVGYCSIIPYCHDSSIFYLVTNFQPECWTMKSHRTDLQPSRDIVVVLGHIYINLCNQEGTRKENVQLTLGWLVRK